MRAYEITTETENRRPVISLRHLNDLKHEIRAREASHARHNNLVRTMYGSPAKEHELIELEKARLELAQQKAELAATKAEANVETSDAINGMAKAGVHADQKGRSNVADMARTEMRRRKD